MPSSLEILSTIGAYMLCAISLVLVNKVILNAFSIPLLSMWSQSIFSIFFLIFLNFFGIISVNLERKKLQKNFKNSIFLSSINGFSLIFAAFCLQRVDASAFQVVARSLNTPFALLLSVFFLKEKFPNPLGIIGASLVTSGYFFAIFIDGKSEIDPWGAFWGGVAALVSALHVCVIRLTPSSSSSSPSSSSSLPSSPSPPLSDIELIFHSNLFYSILGLPFAFFFGEFSIFFEILKNNFFELIFSTGVLGLLALIFNFLVVRQVKVTSPVGHMISSGVRGVLQLVFCSFFFDEKLTKGKVGGTFLVCLGGLIYSFDKIYGKKSEINEKKSKKNEEKSGKNMKIYSKMEEEEPSSFEIVEEEDVKKLKKNL